jgi:uncharacterized protein YfaS (alpha-2-macroglobulin family)
VKRSLKPFFKPARILLLLALSWQTRAGAQEFGPWQSLGQVAYTLEGVNLRETPQNDGKRLDSIGSRKVVYVWRTLFDDQNQPEWAQVLYNDHIGYIKHKSLERSSQQQQIATLEPQGALPYLPGKPTQIRMVQGENSTKLWRVRIFPLSSSYLLDHDLDQLQLAGAAVFEGDIEVKTEVKNNTLELPPQKPGAYVVTLAPAGSPEVVQDAAVMLWSNLGVVVKTSPEKSMFWTVNLTTGQPLAGVKVKVWGRPSGKSATLKALGEFVSDASGMLEVGHSAGYELHYQASLQGESTPQWAYGQNDLHSSDTPQIKAFVLTDRPQYRPGESIQVAGMVRQVGAAGYEVYRGEAKLILQNAAGSPLISKNIVLGGMGEFTESLEPGPNAIAGDYQVVVQAGTPKQGGGKIPIRIAPYVQPRINLELNFPKEAVAGEVKGTVNVVPLEGKLSPTVALELWDQVQFEGSLEQDPRVRMQNRLAAEDFPEFPLEQRIPSPLEGGKLLTALNSKTGKENVTLKLEAAIGARKGLPLLHQLTVRSKDDLGREILATRAIKVFAANLVLSGSLQTEAIQGQPLIIQIGARAVGTGNILAKQILDTKIRVLAWEQNTSGANGQTQWSRVERQVSVAKVQTDASGTATLEFTPSFAGDLRLEVTGQDPQARVGKMNLELGWIVGKETHPEPQFSLETNQLSYAVGEVAKVRLRASNLPDGTAVLLGIAGNTLGNVTGQSGRNWRVVQVQKGYASAEFPLEAAHQPGITFQADAVQGGQWFTRRSGLVSVAGPSKLLTVKVQPSSQNYPADSSAEYLIDTRIGSTPVSAWVALTVVNANLYEQFENPTPSPWRYFWGLGEPKVLSRSSFTLAPDPDPLENPNTFANSAFPARPDARDVAFFGTVLTDAQGQGKIRFRLPNSGSSYRISAYGITADTLAGSTKDRLRAAAPLSVTLQSPNMLHHGDHATVYSTLQNDTSAPLSLEVSLNSGKMVLSRKITLEAKSQNTVSWGIDAPSSGEQMPLVLQAQAEKEKLVVRQEHIINLQPSGQIQQKRVMFGSATAETLKDVFTLEPSNQVNNPTSDKTSNQPADKTNNPPADKTNNQPTNQTPNQTPNLPYKLSLILSSDAVGSHFANFSNQIFSPACTCTTPQVAQALLGNLWLSSLAPKLNLSASPALEGAISSNLGQLYALQQFANERGSTGGWGWQGNIKSDAHSTALALEALVLARSQGLEVDGQRLNTAAEKAQVLLEGSIDPNVKVELGLALYGMQTMTGKNLLELASLEGLNFSSKARLAVALAGFNKNRGKNIYFGLGNPNTPLERSWSLLAGLDYDPVATLEPAALELAQLRTSSKMTLAEETVTLFALGKFASLRPQKLGTLPAVTVRLNGTELAKLEAGSGMGGVMPLELSLDKLNLDKLTAQNTLELESAGPLHVVRTLELVGKTAPNPTAGISLERSYELPEVPLDTTVWVKLKFKLEQPLFHLRLTDFIPAGFEVLEDRPLEGLPQDTVGKPLYSDHIWDASQSIFMFTRLDAGEYTISYRLRATSSGKFYAPAPRLESLDDAGVWVLGNSGMVGVK